MNSTAPKKLFGRNFTLMVLGQIISLLGNATLRFALAMTVLDTTGSTVLFASITALSMVPTVLLSPFGGILADRVSRKGIMAVLDFITTALLAGAALLLVGFSAGNEGFLIWVVGGVMIILSIIQSFYQPSVQSSIPSLVAEEKIMAANGVVVQVNAVATLLGPVLGGFLYGIFGLQPILWVCAGCFFFSAVMECFLHIPFVKQEGSGVFSIIRTDFTAAKNFLFRENKQLSKLLFIVAGVNLFMSAMVIIGMPYLIKLYLGLSNQLYGLVQGAMGVGMIAGGLLSGTLGKKLSFSRSHILLIWSALAALPIAAAVVTDAWPMVSFGIIIAALVVMMGSSAWYNVMAQTLLQTMTPPELLGKVMALVGVICMCALPVGQALYGFLFEKAGSLSFLVVIFAAVACCVLGMLSRNVLRKTKFQEE